MRFFIHEKPVLRGSRALILISLSGLLLASAAQAADPCLIFVHGKMDGASAPDWQAGRDYWKNGGDDFIATATQGFTLPHYVIGYHGDRPYWEPLAAGFVASEIVNAAAGLPDASGLNACPSAASGGTFWVVGHSMGGNVMDFILGNANPSDPNFNANGPYDAAAAAIDLVVSVSGSHRGSELADAACGESSFLCNIGGFFVQGCTTTNFWLRSDESVQVRGLAGPPAKTVYLTGGYEAIPLASACLSGEDDGVVQHASQYACNVGPKYKCPVFSKVEMSAFSSDSGFSAAASRGPSGKPLALSTGAPGLGSSPYGLCGSRLSLFGGARRGPPVRSGAQQTRFAQGRRGRLR
ncbi:MAG: hypothetical protein GY937_07850, partial [bacterium]|nr:hypothetical protein [bacterium]